MKKIESLTLALRRGALLLPFFLFSLFAPGLPVPAHSANSAAEGMIFSVEGGHGVVSFELGKIVDDKYLLFGLSNKSLDRYPNSYASGIAIDPSWQYQGTFDVSDELEFSVKGGAFTTSRLGLDIGIGYRIREEVDIYYDWTNFLHYGEAIGKKSVVTLTGGIKFLVTDRFFISLSGSTGRDITLGVGGIF